MSDEELGTLASGFVTVLTGVVLLVSIYQAKRNRGSQ